MAFEDLEGLSDQQEVLDKIDRKYYLVPQDQKSVSVDLQAVAEDPRRAEILQRPMKREQLVVDRAVWFPVIDP